MKTSKSPSGWLGVPRANPCCWFLPPLTSRPSGPVGKAAAAFLKRLEKSPHRHPVPGSSQSVILEAYDLSVLAVVNPPLFQIVDHATGDLPLAGTFARVNLSNARLPVRKPERPSASASWRAPPSCAARTACRGRSAHRTLIPGPRVRRPRHREIHVAMKRRCSSPRISVTWEPASGR